MSPDEQISGASNISIAKMVDEIPMADGRTKYKFLVQRRLIGSDDQEFTVWGVAAPLNDTSYDSHDDPSFWQRGGGRSFADTSCAIRPSFLVGNSYIVFFGSTPTKRSFEKIEAANGVVNLQHKWLIYIEEKLHSLDQKKRN